MKKEQDDIHEQLSYLVDIYLNLPIGIDLAPQTSDEFIQETRTVYLVAELLIDQINQQKASPNEVVSEIAILYDDFISQHPDKIELHNRLKHFCQQAQARSWIAFADQAIPYVKQGNQEALINFRYAYKQCTLHLIQAELILNRRTKEMSESVARSLFNAGYTDLSLKIADVIPKNKIQTKNFNPPTSLSSLN